MSELREVFEMVTKQTEPDLDAWREQEQRQRRTSRNRKWGALAIAATIGVVAVVLLVRAGGGPTATQPGGQGTGTNANPSTEPIPAVTNGSLEPGTYVIITTDPGFNASHQITIDVPAGYGGFNDGLAVFSTSLPTAGVGMWTADYSFSDACNWTGTRSATSSGDDLVAALVGQQSLRPSPPTDVVVSGFAGTFIELTAPAQSRIDRCSGEHLRLWTNTNGGAKHLNDPGQHELLWIVDVDGERLVIEAPLAAEASAEVRAELVQMVESVQIDPA